MNKITAQEGKVFRRLIDGLIFGNEIYLGIDYSTGEAREDKSEYYEQIDEEIIETETETETETDYNLLLQEHNLIGETL